MKTLVAAILTLGFATTAAVACPMHDEQAKQAEKKDTKDTKQAQAPKADAKPAPKAEPKPAPAPKAPSEKTGKVSSR
ncbi:MAG: hypothetical protein R3B06_17855 [Kofleriaceae bacterium]